MFFRYEYLAEYVHFLEKPEENEIAEASEEPQVEEAQQEEPQINEENGDENRENGDEDVLKLQDEAKNEDIGEEKPDDDKKKSREENVEMGDNTAAVIESSKTDEKIEEVEIESSEEDEDENTICSCNCCCCICSCIKSITKIYLDGKAASKKSNSMKEDIMKRKRNHSWESIDLTR